MCSSASADSSARADRLDGTGTGGASAALPFSHRLDAGRLRSDEAVVLDEVAWGIDVEVGGEQAADRQACCLERDERDRGHEAVGVQFCEADGAGEAAHRFAEVGCQPAPLALGEAGEV